MKKRWTKILGLTLALLLVGGMALSASAANGSPTGLGLVRQGIMAGQQRAQTALKEVAALTGLSLEEVRTQRAAGESLADIAEDKGISEQTVIDKVAAERLTVLNQLKEDNKITETQYQDRVTNMQSRIKANIERTAVGPANGDRVGQGMGRRQGAGQGQGQGLGRGMGPGAGQNQGTCIYNTNS